MPLPETPEKERQESDINGSMNYSDLLNNLDISRGERETEIKYEPKPTNVDSDSETRVSGIPERRSKRLTKTNPIVRFNNPIMLSEYRKRNNKNATNGETSNRPSNNGRNGLQPTTTGNEQDNRGRIPVIPTAHDLTGTRNLTAPETANFSDKDG